jgi:hypothetical protein
MDTDYTAFFTLQCWGCGKCATRGYHDHKEMEAQTELLKKDGWTRYTFGPGASPWFCGKDCGLHSYNAVRAKEWWGNHFVNARRNKRLLLAGLTALVVIIVVIEFMNLR